MLWPTPPSANGRDAAERRFPAAYLTEVSGDVPHVGRFDRLDDDYHGCGNASWDRFHRTLALAIIKVADLQSFRIAPQSAMPGAIDVPGQSVKPLASALTAIRHRPELSRLGLC